MRNRDGACIGIILRDCIRWITVQRMGDLRYAGLYLLRYYNSKEMAEKLITVGNVISVGKRLTSCEKEPVSEKDVKNPEIFTIPENSRLPVIRVVWRGKTLDEKEIIHTLCEASNSIRVYLFDTFLENWYIGTDSPDMMYAYEMWSFGIQADTFYLQPLSNWQDIFTKWKWLQPVVRNKVVWGLEEDATYKVRIHADSGQNFVLDLIPWNRYDGTDTFYPAIENPLRVVVKKDLTNPTQPFVGSTGFIRIHHVIERGIAAITVEGTLFV